MGWRYSNEQIQFANTVMLDLSATEDELLARMKPKTRYNVRLAERKGVKVRQGSAHDLDLLYQLYAETSVRDGFVIRSIDYYHTLWNTFLKAGMVDILIAEVDEQPIAALILFKFQRKAWFLYGMSREMHRDKMPNYLLQWEAIRQSKRAGCHTYDLWGAPYQFVESDPLWGVYRFKDGLGGQVVRHIGAWDLPVRMTGYRLFTQLLPRVLAVMRSQGMARTTTRPVRKHLIDAACYWSFSCEICLEYKIAHLPTPVEFLPNLTGLCGGPKIYAKRDDQTGLALGGNKARKLEFLLAEALTLGADTSDHSRCSSIEPLPPDCSSGCSMPDGLHTDFAW